jgi:hypothetical protein
MAYLAGWTLFALFFISEDAGRLLYQGQAVQWHGYLVVWLTTAYAWAFLGPIRLVAGWPLSHRAPSLVAQCRTPSGGELLFCLD